MRRLLVAGNWKMHGSTSMTAELLADLINYLNTASFAGSQTDVLVCPAAPYLSQANELLANQPIKLGAQNVSQFSEGAYTGEIALNMLADFDCQYVILGHSERRQFFAETDQIIADKFVACSNAVNPIIPILCVGETLQQRQNGNTKQVIEAQLMAVLNTAGIAAFNNAVIAYEPVWAIGTGETATPEQAQDVHAFIRQKLAVFDQTVAEKIQILYGGSVKPENAASLFMQPDIDGSLVGGAALQAEGFVEICLIAEKIK